MDDAKRTRTATQRHVEEKASIKHNMQPPASIMNTFSRLNYKPHYAIAEFVDNSTQSYLLHREELRAAEDNFMLSIVVKYNASEKTLTIDDNAYGMELDRFRDAITLDAKNSEQTNSRNEFGMGLKTAASWFGNIWTVSSTALGSTKRYTATVDIPFLQESGENEVDIIVSPADPAEHGTSIEIKQVTKGIGPRAVGKTRSMLASMYRRDLDAGEISIEINDVQIEFQHYPILTFRDQDWRKNLSFDVNFGGRTFHVTGFVGIMNPGSFPRAGFALFRRNRVIIGGEDQNYKPYEIFRQSQSQISLKLFGELDMDDFPVNQAKDGFIWDDGLEDEFIKALQENIREYVEIAKMSKDARVQEEQYSNEASLRVEEEVSKDVERANRLIENEESEQPIESQPQLPLLPERFVFDGTQTEEELEKALREGIESDNNSKPDYVSPSRTYGVRLNKVSTRHISVAWKISGGDKWIEVQPGDSEDQINVTINVNHPFFKPYSNEEEFQYVLEKFVIAFVVAEEQAKLNADKDGYIMNTAIRNHMNRYLQRLTEK